MQTIRREDKMIASSLHPDIASRAPAPSRTERRPRRPIVLLLCGLTLFGVAAPPAADMAYGERILHQFHDKCVATMIFNLLLRSNLEDKGYLAEFFAVITCNNQLNGASITKSEQHLLDYVLTFGR
jgi:hypothetical protein